MNNFYEPPFTSRHAGTSVQPEFEDSGLAQGQDGVLPGKIISPRRIWYNHHEKHMTPPLEAHLATILDGIS